MAISCVESDVGSVNRSCNVRRTLASSLLIGYVSLKRRKIRRRRSLLTPGCLSERIAEPVPRIDAKYLQRFRLRHEFELFQRQFERALFRMALDIDVKLRRREAAIDHIAFQLGHIDAVGGEPAKGLVQRRRNVAHLKDKSSDDALFPAARPFWLARQYDEAGGIVFGVGDVLLENAKAIDFRRQPGRQRRAGDVAGFSDFACGAGGVGGYHRLDAELA